VTITAQAVDVTNTPVALGGLVVGWSASGGGSFASPTSTTDANGVATVTFTVTTSAGVTQTINALTDNIFGFTTVKTVAGAATSLSFTQQPTAGTAGTTMSTVTVTLLDSYGNVATGSTNPVSLSIAAGPSGAMLSGGAARPAVAGIATFSSLSIDLAGAGYRLMASSAGLPSATSNAFDVASTDDAPTVPLEHASSPVGR
jgi:hypothetical protein